MKNLYAGLRHLFTLVVLLLAASAVGAQAPAWNMALSMQSGTSNTAVQAMTTDAGGNVYLAGVFDGTVQLGATTLVGAAGSTHAFVAKWNSASQSYVWAQKISGVGANFQVAGLAVEGANVYVAGKFNSLQPLVFGNISLTSANRSSYEIFVAKLTETGSGASFVWAKQAGGAGRDVATAIAVRNGSVYVVGCAETPATFDNFTLTHTGGQVTYVAKLTDTGPTATFTWVQQTTGAGASAALAVAVQGSAVYLCGISDASIVTFGSIRTSYGAGEMFVAKLTDTGPTSSFIWVQQAGNGIVSHATALAVSGANVYLGGLTSGTSAFGAVTLTVAGSRPFVAKLVDAGASVSVAWATEAGGATEILRGLAVSGSRLYATGTTGGSTTLYDYDLVTTGSTAVFLTKLTDNTTAGPLAWVQRTFVVNTGSRMAAYGVATSGSTVYTSGYVSGGAFFGALSVASSQSSNVGFLAALTDPTLTATTPTLPAAGIALFPSPAHGRATVQLPAVPGATTATLTILDALGRALRTQTAATNAQAELDLTGLAPGLYAVRVAAGGGAATRRLVVE